MASVAKLAAQPNISFNRSANSVAFIRETCVIITAHRSRLIRALGVAEVRIMRHPMLLALTMFLVALIPLNAQQSSPKARMCLSSKSMKERASKYEMPKYPSACKCDGITTIWVLVNREGKVERIVPISGHPLTRLNSAKAVKEWVFKPMLENGFAVEFGGYLDFRFTDDDKVFLEEGESSNKSGVACHPTAPPNNSFNRSGISLHFIVNLDASC